MINQITRNNASYKLEMRCVTNFILVIKRDLSVLTHRSAKAETSKLVTGNKSTNPHVLDIDTPNLHNVKCKQSSITRPKNKSNNYAYKPKHFPPANKE